MSKFIDVSELKCNSCGGNNLCPDPSLYEDCNAKDERGGSYFCLDCKFKKKNPGRIILKDLGDSKEE